MIELYAGTIGSGKSYHALEVIIETLRKGKHVIANFPLKFSANHITNGMADRFMYISDEELMGENGMKLLYRISRDYNFYGNESSCLVVIDEAGEYFPSHQYQAPEQQLWKLFFTQSRKLGYDFKLITQDDKAINRTIRKTIEYEIMHRKANNVFPFSILPFTIFMHVRYWNKTPKVRLKSGSTILVKKIIEMYDTHRLFAGIEEKLDLKESEVIFSFGNLISEEERVAALQKRKLKFMDFYKKDIS